MAGAYATQDPILLGTPATAPGWYRGAFDPSAAGQIANLGSLFSRTDTGQFYWKSGAANTDWTAVSAGADGIFGPGVDGAIVDAGNRTLASSAAYTDWTINAGVIITPARFLLICNGTLTINAGAAIRANGNNGGPGTPGGTGGGVGGAGILGVGSLGGTGGLNGTGGAAGTQSTQQPTGIGTTCQGGAGGAAAGGGAIGGGGAGGPMTLQAATSGNPYLAGPGFGFYPSANTPQIAVNGGSGGGGGSAGVGATAGGGGGGGGVIVIIAKHIINLGAIEVFGGDGAAATVGNAGGGGGGGGGKALIICRTYSGTAPNVSGGLGGNPSGTGNFGAVGNLGQFIQLAM